MCKQKVDLKTEISIKLELTIKINNYNYNIIMI